MDSNLIMQLTLQSRLNKERCGDNDLSKLFDSAIERIAELEKNLLLAEDLLSDDSYQYYLDSTGKSSALKEQGNG